MIKIHSKPKKDNDMHTFSEALEALKEGKKIARINWNGKGLYVRLVATSTGILATKQDVDYDTRVIINSHFVIKSAENQFDTWAPSVSDCLAEDWIIV